MKSAFINQGMEGFPHGCSGYIVFYEHGGYGVMVANPEQDIVFDAERIPRFIPEEVADWKNEIKEVIDRDVVWRPPQWFRDSLPL